MMALYSIISGILGAFIGIFPLSIEGHFSFFKKVTATVYGAGNFSVGSDTAFLIYLGIFIALFILFYDKIIGKKELLKEFGIYMAVYLPAALVSAFFESSVMLCVFICLNVVFVYSCDYMEKPRFDGKNANYAMMTAVFLGGLSGFSEIAFVFLAGLLIGKKTNHAINYALLLYIPMTLLKAVLHLIKACIFGFSLNFGWSLMIVFFTALTAIFAVSFLKKTALRKNFRLYAYYLALFAVIVIYTLMKG